MWNINLLEYFYPKLLIIGQIKVSMGAQGIPTSYGALVISWPPRTALPVSLVAQVVVL